MNGICGVHHLSLKTTAGAYLPTVAFYRDILELPVLRVQTGATFLSCGNVVLEILNSGEEREKGGALDHVAFFTPDVDAAIERVRQAGCEITMEPKDHIFPGKTPYAVHIAFFRGPAGEDVELFCEL